MAILGQGNGGNWTLTISHNKTGIEIPATFTYKGVSTSFTITDTEQTIETGWETPLGTAILLEDITRVYDEVVVGNRKYKVSSDDFTIKAYEEEEHEIRQTITVSPMNTTVSSGTSRQLTVTMHTYVDGVETATTNVTSSATYTRSNSAITVSSGGKITWNNNSTAETTATVTVSYPSAGVEPVVVNVTVSGKAVDPEPAEGTISVTPTSLDFDYLSEKQKTFTVNTTGVTSVKLASGGTNGSKFSFTPLTGTNGTVFTVETKENNISDQDYTGIVVVSDNNGVATDREITVNQKYEPIMQQFASTTFPATGGSIYFTIHTDYDVVFRSVPNYITISCDETVYNEGQRISASEANNKTFVLTAAANTGNARTVQTTFNMGHYIGNELQNRVRYFSFTQEAAEPEPVKRLYILQEDFPVTSAATAISVTVTCENCEFNRFNYSQTGDFNIAAERSIGNTINLFFPANTGINEDSAIITFDLYDENNNLYNDTITLRRAGAEYIPSAEFEIPLHIEWNIPNGKTAFYEVKVSLMENGNEHSSASHSSTVTGDSTQDNTYEGTLQFNPTTEFDAVKITTRCVNITEPENQIMVTVIYDQCGNDNPGTYNLISSGEAYELTCDSVNSGNIDEADIVYVTISLN